MSRYKTPAEGSKSFLGDLEDALRFDKNHMDDALIEQPDLFYRVSREYASAISERDGLKLEIAELAAELDKSIREEAARMQTKTTETGIQNEIASTPKMADMKRKYAGVAHQADRWLALKEAYQQRAYALKDLAGLWVAGYFTNSSAGAARSDAKARQADDIRRERTRQRDQD